MFCGKGVAFDDPIDDDSEKWPERESEEGKRQDDQGQPLLLR